MFKKSALAVSLVLILAFAGAALAGKTPAGTSSISLHTVAGAASTNPTYGSTVSFDVATTQTSSPFVNLLCYQGKTLVAQGWDAYFTGGLGGQTFTLSSPAWTGGAADCTANLDMFVNYKWVVLASTSFHVDA